MSYQNTWKALLAGAGICLLLSLAGCGGGAAAPGNAQNPLQGSGALGGGGGNAGGGGGGGGATPVGSPQGVEGTFAGEAALGLDMTYTPGLAAGQATVEAPHSGSVVIGGGDGPSGFIIIDLTMMADGVPVNWDLTTNTFYEGDNVDLYIKYQTFQSMNLLRHWLSTDINLDYTELNVSHSVGVYSVKLDYAIPYGTARPSAIFKFDLASANEAKVSDNFPYTILAPTGTTTITYPQGSDGDPSLSTFSAGYAQLVAEDLIANSDYDYNDFVGRLTATEFRNAAGQMTQITMRLKATARGAGYDSDWQINFGGSFPGASATATVDQYYVNGTRHGNQRIWNSTNGVSLPVFTPLRLALPNPPGSYATNAVAGTNYIDGDYADIKIFFNPPLNAGTYSQIPYKPELRVTGSSSNIYVVQWWIKPGDPVDSNGYPLAFVVPDTFAWPMESQNITSCYSTFDDWLDWIATPNAGNTADPNTYMTSGGGPTLGPNVLGGGTPRSRSSWTTSSTAQDEFHASSPTGQLSTLNLIKYLNGDGTQTSASLSKTVLSPLQTTRSWFGSSLPLPTSNISNSNNTSDGFTRLDNYLTGGTTSATLNYSLSAELLALVMNVERGKIKPNAWTYVSSINEVRAVAVDSLIPGKLSVIAQANAAFNLSSNTANNATKTLWRNVCQSLNGNTTFVQDQPVPVPNPMWYNTTPTGNYFRRNLFN